MNSLPWIGKLTGCLGADGVIHRFGYKKTMYTAATVQIVALISKRYPYPSGTKLPDLYTSSDAVLISLSQSR